MSSVEPIGLFKDKTRGKIEVGSKVELAGNGWLRSPKCNHKKGIEGTHLFNT